MLLQLLPEGGDVGGSSVSSSSSAGGFDGLAFFEGDVDWSFREDVYTRRGGLLALLITTGSWSPPGHRIRSEVLLISWFCFEVSNVEP